jgi:hypothetical protein
VPQVSNQQATVDTTVPSPVQAGNARVSRSLGRHSEPGGFACGLFCLFTVSYLLHFGARLPVLGSIRFDLLVAGVAFTSMVMSGALKRAMKRMDPTVKWIGFLLVYIVVTLPFVEWPGSVLRQGLEPFIKSLCFFFFVMGTVTTEGRLKTFIAVFLSCQVFRVLEPLYLHIFQGYWGSTTDMGTAGSVEFMSRLSGAPYDVINPNGLAQVILIAMSMLYCLLWPGKAIAKVSFLALCAVLTYALLLSGSRSGFLVFVMLIGYIVWHSRFRIVALMTAVLAAVIAMGSLSDLQKDRYLSIYSKDAKGAATAQGRIEGVIADFGVALERPLFGHGLGTSTEAIVHSRGLEQISHNLFTEVAQELGFVGLAIFMGFILAAIRNCLLVVKAARSARASPIPFMSRVSEALLVLMIVNLVFSFASYGLSEYEWYLMSGLSVVIVRLSGVEGIPNSGSAKQRRTAVRQAPA